MKILHLSDTHGQHNRLPELPWADVIIHSGDFSFGGSKREIIDFLNWFCYLPYKYKIFIAGNHDDFLWDSEIDFLPENCYGLRYSCVTIEGVKFHGIPMFVQDCVSGLINTGIEKIRPDTDVLITHCPPFEILDFDNNYLHRRLCDLCKVDIGVSENRGGNRAYFQRRNRLPNKQKIYAERA